MQFCRFSIARLSDSHLFKTAIPLLGTESYSHKIIWFVSGRSTADITFNLIVIINPFSAERSSLAGVSA